MILKNSETNLEYSTLSIYIRNTKHDHCSAIMVICNIVQEKKIEFSFLHGQFGVVSRYKYSSIYYLLRLGKWKYSGQNSIADVSLS